MSEPEAPPQTATQRAKPQQTRLPLPEPPPDEPFALLARWLVIAERHERHARAACLATIETADHETEPAADARIVLVHGDLARGEVLLGTDDRSPKARQTQTAPRVALVFHWRHLDAQVRLRGIAGRAFDAEDDQTFEDRPRRSRAVAWASRQSAVLVDPDELARRVAAVDERFAAAEQIPRPPTWRALRVAVDEVELWRAGARRLHRRLRWRLAGDAWRCERLEP
ncbi:MAG: pyridoxal 5'-phosphate synthase [Acidobacteriota bacterium]